MTREVLQQALDAMEQHGAAYLGHLTEYRKAIAAAKAALAQPVQPEPWTPEDTAHRPGGLSLTDWEAIAADQAMTIAMMMLEQEPVAWGIVASNTGRICQVVLDADEVADHKPEYIKPLYASPPQRQPLTDEQDRALCEAYCNGASDEYFKARPALDFPEMRRIFYAGHRKAWITRDAAHGIGEKT